MSQPGRAERSIRSQLNRVVLIPSVTFLLLFAAISGATLMRAVSLHIAASDGRSGVQLYTTVVELQKERRLAVEFLAGPSPRALQALRGQADATDATIDDLQDRGPALRGHGEATVQKAATVLFGALDQRTDLRKQVMASTIGRGAAIDGYRELIDPALGLYDVTGRLLADGPAVSASADALRLMRAQEQFAEADAMLSGSFGDDGLTGPERTRFAGLYSATREYLANAVPALTGAPAGAHRALTEASEWRRTATFAERVADDARAAPERADWRAVADPVAADLIVLADAQAEFAVDATAAAANRAFALAAVGAAIAMLAGSLAYIAASRSAGRLIARLASLRADALGLARDDLPRIVRRLGRGEPVDLDTELQHLDYGDDEVGQVADAFNIAQRTAVSAAVKQAEIRDGANRVFLGIAHRNQSLVQRQLQLLDRIEREEDDPDLLHELFQLDHLATRGRRNAENLIILGGSQPGRRWRNPIRLVDVLRGAISETEEYARVKLRLVPDIALHGAAVADIIHLVAELVENATAFSPPHSVVQIHCENVPKGVVLEIEDRGLGMSDQAFSDANGTLSDAPEYDVMAMTDDARLGLFVVARLAEKHGVRVELRPSPYGGVRAVVLLPSVLIAPQHDRGAETRQRSLRAVGARSDGGAPPAEPSGDLLASATGAGPGADPRRRPPRERPPEPPATAKAPLPSVDALPKRQPRVGSAGALDGAADGAAPGGGTPGLPKRRRQASLAPQLRSQENGPGVFAEQAAPAGGTDRSPEEIRRTLSAFQSGTRRGREADPADNGSPPAQAPSGPQASAPRGGDGPAREPAGSTSRGTGRSGTGDPTEKSE
ncbi:signal transduction histidine kinase [Murinocardiopsis flavida]|uniref:histidine kinase n=1 Tax=Murinocardiopsis flavida TaxID=645275 RepID=A0A2P8DK83_9ACTN|nr:nitrate- and nitrite sensing domain-containing protein [Murinocardiopsis flavida]PSK97624.1 signal transduction histidine kinase [Murinocardiopsis flavida]